MKLIVSNLAAAILLCCLLTISCQQAAAPKPFGAIPTPQQVKWQRMEMNMFCHFGPNTFTGEEWGNGKETEDIFNPTAMDCSQWVSIAKEAGFKGIILTAKHHDGFCLWPNAESRHTVRQSKWREGKGDVLKDLSDACRQQGVRFGVYISPWDRNAPSYGTEEYNGVFLRTLQSALSNYGDVFEQWFDGANGEGPNGKQQAYDWEAFNTQVLKLQPQAVIFSDVGPGCRWVGNEEGNANETCWSTINTDGCTPSGPKPIPDTLFTGQRMGSQWVPAETDVSIRPGWFWHQNEHPKSLQLLLKSYYCSVGRNSLLLLNVPPDSRGLIPQEDSLRLMELRQALDAIFAHDLAQGAKIKASSVRGKAFRPQNLLDTAYNTYWAASDDINAAQITLTFPEPRTFNRLMLQEYIPLGQRVESFYIEYLNKEGDWQPVPRYGGLVKQDSGKGCHQATTIGYKRILPFPTITTTAFRVVLEETLACPVLNRIALYNDTIYKAEAQQPTISK